MELAKDQEIIVKDLMTVLHKASEVDDEVTSSIASDRIEIHQKNLWMLKSSI